jgi:hypothetical protein
MLKRRRNTAERFRAEFWEVLEEWNKIENFLNRSKDQNTLCDLQNRRIVGIPVIVGPPPVDAEGIHGSGRNSIALITVVKL